MREIEAQMPEGSPETIDREAELHAMPSTAPASLSKAQRAKLYQKTIRGIAMHDGLNGVEVFKKANPDAASIRVSLNALAYSPKPAGYDAYLVALVGRWLDSDACVNSTNVADVTQLNVRLSSAFDPGKHFSQPLSPGRLKKITELFAARAMPLSAKGAMTMSKVREVAKVVRAAKNADQPFGSVGVISGRTLSANGRNFPIVLNGDRKCIRVMIGEKRRRLYLDELVWIADWLVPKRVDPLSTTTSSIGEVAYRLESDLNGGREPLEMSDVAYSLASPVKERLAALKRLAPPAGAEDFDALCD